MIFAGRMQFQPLQKTSLDKFRLQRDSCSCPSDSDWAQLPSELQSHTLEAKEVLEGSSLPRRNLLTTSESSLVHEPSGSCCQSLSQFQWLATPPE